NPDRTARLRARARYAARESRFSTGAQARGRSHLTPGATPRIPAARPRRGSRTTRIGDDAPGRNRCQRGCVRPDAGGHALRRNDRRLRTPLLGTAERAGLAHLRDVLRSDADLLALRRGAARGHARTAGEPAGPVLDAAPGEGGAVFRRQSRSSRADAARRTDARALVRRRDARASRALGLARGGDGVHE